MAKKGFSCEDKRKVSLLQVAVPIDGAKKKPHTTGDHVAHVISETLILKQH